MTRFYEPHYPFLRSWPMLAGLLFLGLSAFPARAAGPQVVIELFTSQSCSSCPPAERLLAQIQERGDALGVEWHVDYWDDLVAGRRGRWRDPYSAPAFTRRQRDYNQRLRGTRAVYTPQMIVAGRAELPGFRETRVKKHIRESAKGLGAFSGAVTRLETGALRLSLDGPPGLDAILWRVDVIAAAQTDVARGENQGKTLVNHNIARALTQLGAWTGGPISLDLPAVGAGGEAGTGCVILAQDADLGPVLFGLACPEAG
ncbi:MAG: DUF1223 domain-containing protein [Alphaproteobacteria bacterium]